MKAFIDGSERRARVGAPVESLLSAEQRRAAGKGALLVVDAWGQRVGLKGTPADGGAYFTVIADARPPSVNACLEAWGTLGYAPALPGELVKFLVKRAITMLGEAGGAASAQRPAAFAAATASREDAAAMWAYVAGGGARVAIFVGGQARVQDVAPDVAAAVVATRDVLTFRSGATTFDYLDGITALEVGTTNKVKLTDYTSAFADADAVVTCRAADFAIEGFVASPDLDELAAAAAAAGIVFVNISADGALFDERGTPRRLAGDAVVWATPREARPYDLVFSASPGLNVSAGDPTLFEEAAAALWTYGKAVRKDSSTR
jgi:hypothetical protein